MLNKLKNNKVLKKVLSILFYVISGFLLLYILISLIAPNSVIDIFRFRTYTVLTKSMEPVILKDDVVFIYKVNPDKLEKDDIITFMADFDYDGQKELVTHYIHSVNEYSDGTRFFKTIRHGGTVPDSWELSDQEIIGKYGFRLNQMGLVVEFLRSGFGIATVAVNIIIIGSIIYILKSGKKEEVLSQD